MEVNAGDLAERWDAGEPDPAHGGSPAAWTCWWMPLPQAHVLAAGLGAGLGRLGQHEKGP
ncbi:hypothetical protein [Arthrobacter yangruifuii]|uniref:hypothetical protein n=1 Tax=Arthrobacter yangruifuii TaxID=2606616 RepID=UPI001AEDA495|nr:hypothetical protein [Arthrobacter yangruifuii]